MVASTRLLLRGGALEFKVLGPLEVRRGAVVLPLGGPGQRMLLAVLILCANEIVSTDRLSRLLWEDEPPDTAKHILQINISRLRKVLEAEPSNPRVLLTRSPGYMLRVPGESIDALRFQTLVEEGQGMALEEPERAAATLAEALALWRGEVLADLPIDPSRLPGVARLEEIRLAAIEDRVDAELALGHHAGLVGELRSLVSAYPFRERITRQLMIALYRSGRQSEALSAFEDARSRLASEVGIDPGSQLQALEQLVLRHDPSLDLSHAPARNEQDNDLELATHEVRKTTTVLYCDVAVSAVYGESPDPERLHRALLRSFETMRSSVVRHGGIIEKSIGQGTMAVFGIPQVQEDDALRAVRAAADVQQAIAVLNKELERDFSMNVSVRIGINTGEAIADDRSGDHMIAGSAANVAARLEQAAAPNEILLGEATHQLVRGAVDTESIASLDVAEGEAGYRLLRVTGSLGFTRRFETPLVGREGELRLLADAFDRVTQDHTSVLFTVLGPAGIGKSRLVQEFLSSVGDAARVLRGRCLSYGDGITYWPIVEVITSAANLRDTDAPGVTLTKIAALVEGEVEAPVIAERLAQILGLAGATASPEETFWAVRKLLETLSARGTPLIVDLDDLEWGESTLLDLVEHVADWSRNAPILLICSARTELLDARPGWGGGKMNATSITLEPLTPADAQVVAQNVLGSLPPEVAALVAETAEGNPLFVEQFVGMLAERGSVRLVGDRWALGQEMADIVTPPTVVALLEARLERLSLSERTTLERAAVEGKVFHLGSLLAMSSDPDRARCVESLRSLMRRDLVRPDASAFLGEEGFRFRHNLIRDAAYARLTKDARATLHQRHATWLEATTSARPGEFDEIIGWHLEQAYSCLAQLGGVDDSICAIGERAGDLLAAGARRADERGDYRAELNLLRRVILLPAASLVVGGHRQLDLLQAANRSGEHINVSRQAVNEAFAVATDSRDPSLAIRSRATELFVRAMELTREVDLEEESDKLERELEDGTVTAESQCVALRMVGYMRHWQGREEVAAKLGRRALAIARSANLGSEARSCLELICRTYLMGPTPAAQALHQLEELGNQPEANRAVKTLADLMRSYQMLCGGREGDARAIRDRVELELRELGQLAETSDFLNLDRNLATDDWRAAAARDREIIASFEERGRLGNVGTYCAHLAAVLVESGDGSLLEEATVLIDRAKRLTLPYDRLNLVQIAQVEASLASRINMSADAERHAREAIELATASDWIDLQGETWSTLAEVFFAADRPLEAEDAVHEAIRRFEQRGNVEAVGRSRRLLAGSSGSTE